MIKKKKYKKGDKVKYRQYFPPSTMISWGNGEFSDTEYKGIITKCSKHWTGKYIYTLKNGITLQDFEILGLVD